MKTSTALAILMALPAAALATPSGEYSRARIDNTSCGLNAASTATCAIGSTSASANDPAVSAAAAQASLANATVSISASSNGTFGSFAEGLAEFWDSFAFQGVLPGQMATLTISGHASHTGSASLNYFAELAPAGTIFPPDGGNGALTAVPNDGDWTVSTSWAIANGTLDNGAYILNAGLRGTTALCGADGCPGDLLANASVQLVLPDGVTFTASTASAVADIPEPASMSLLALLPGLAWLRGVSRARRRDRAAAD